jgi:hypothetical protein
MISDGLKRLVLARSVLRTFAEATPIPRDCLLARLGYGAYCLAMLSEKLAGLIQAGWGLFGYLFTSVDARITILGS